MNLTIGLPTYDDYDGVYFTVQALRLYHPRTPLIIVDNHPDGPFRDALERLANGIGDCKYVALPNTVGSAIAKQQVFKQSQTEYTLCIDSHVLIVPGAIQRLLHYLAANPGTNSLLQGPLLYDDGKSISTHFKPGWGSGMYGQWATDDRGIEVDAAPFEIPMQGLGLFCTRTDDWLGFNEQFRGFGGEEFYLHEKYRQAGRQVLCLPFLRWMHRFYRKSIPYANLWEDRVYNYYIGFADLGMETWAVDAHFKEHLGEEVYAGVRNTVLRRIAGV